MAKKKKKKLKSINNLNQSYIHITNADSPIVYIVVIRVRNRNYIQKEMTPLSHIF